MYEYLYLYYISKKKSYSLEFRHVEITPSYNQLLSADRVPTRVRVKVKPAIVRSSSNGHGRRSKGLYLFICAHHSIGIRVKKISLFFFEIHRNSVGSAESDFKNHYFLN
jgi:hypothetical protein